MMAKSSGALLVLFIVSGCAVMKPTDFEDATPRLLIEEYFLGET